MGSSAQRCFDVLPKLCSTFPAELEESSSLESLVNGITSAKKQEGVQDSDFSVLAVQLGVMSLEPARQVDLHRQSEIQSAQNAFETIWLCSG